MCLKKQDWDLHISRSHMSEFILRTLKEEYKAFFEDVMAKNVAIVFDGTTRYGEAMVTCCPFY